MKRFFTVSLLLFIAATNLAYGQKSVDKVKFFQDTSVIHATLTINIKKVLSKRDKEGYIFPATFACKLSDSLDINDQINVQIRGHSRRAVCYLPPFKLIYKNNPSAAFYRLKSLKLVNACSLSSDDDQNLLKEFLIYKMYNLFTEKSFRARLLNLTYLDSSGSKKPVTRHAFLLEDIGEVAKRNKCEDWSDKKFKTESTNRTQMTLVALFEYMIGNTDWSVPADHNIKILHPKNDSLTRPYTVPYDFDYSGLVNTSYAQPDESLKLESVRQRLYRGFPRSMEELEIALDNFRKQKENIYALINNFNLLTPRTKTEMTDYLDGFFSMIDHPDEVKEKFISDARTQ